MGFQGWDDDFTLDGGHEKFSVFFSKAMIHILLEDFLFLALNQY